MREMRQSETEMFPEYGARARCWVRFERDLREWLETPDGRFATWRAAAATAGPVEDEDR